MAHYQQLKLFETVASHLPQYFVGKQVLEVGSWDVNGSIRACFKDCSYLGADIAAGPGVDLVVPGERIDCADASFDVTVSAECFEHNPQWVATFRNMVRMLKPNGLCVVTCATLGRSEHGTSRKHRDASLTALESHDDHYANLSKRDFERELDPARSFADYQLHYNRYGCDLYFVGIKKAEPPVTALPPALSADIGAITEPKAPGWARALNIRLTFWLKFLFASVLGERKYHDFKFNARRLLRKLGSSK